MNARVIREVIAAHAPGSSPLDCNAFAAISAPASKFFPKPVVRASFGPLTEPRDNAIEAETRIPIERHKRNSHSELSPDVQRNSSGLKLNKVPAKKTNAEPFCSFNRTFIRKDCNDRLTKAARM